MNINLHCMFDMYSYERPSGYMYSYNEAKCYYSFLQSSSQLILFVSCSKYSLEPMQSKPLQCHSTTSRSGKKPVRTIYHICNTCQQERMQTSCQQDRIFSTRKPHKTGPKCLLQSEIFSAATTKIGEHYFTSHYPTKWRHRSFPNGKPYKPDVSSTATTFGDHSITSHHPTKWKHTDISIFHARSYGNRTKSCQGAVKSPCIEFRGHHACNYHKAPQVGFHQCWRKKTCCNYCQVQFSAWSSQAEENKRYRCGGHAVGKEVTATQDKKSQQQQPLTSYSRII